MYAKDGRMNIVETNNLSRLRSDLIVGDLRYGRAWKAIVNVSLDGNSFQSHLILHTFNVLEHDCLTLEGLFLVNYPGAIAIVQKVNSQRTGDLINKME